MAKHNLETEKAEDYELLQKVSEEKGVCLWRRYVCVCGDVMCMKVSEEKGVCLWRCYVCVCGDVMSV